MFSGHWGEKGKGERGRGGAAVAAAALEPPEPALLQQPLPLAQGPQGIPLPCTAARALVAPKGLTLKPENAEAVEAANVSAVEGGDAMQVDAGRRGP
eukprot:1148712-Pelagomonas_calceolata.AAC.7